MRVEHIENPSAWLDRCHFGDCLETMHRMPDGLVQTCVTSPPYFGLRDYGHAGQIGLEPTPAEFVTKLVEVFREVRRVLRDDGTLWLNLGDSYGSSGTNRNGSETSGLRSNRASDVSQKNVAPRKVETGLKPKDLIGIPWRVAFALQADGWYLRQDIIWHKPNPMPESVQDRCAKAHEYIFLLSKSPSYYCDMGAIKEAAEGRAPEMRAELDAAGCSSVQLTGRGGFGGETRNKRSVWTVATTPYKGAHFATFPTDLIEPCVLAGAPAGGVVLDPFFGSGTTGQVAQNLGRQFIGCELNRDYEPLQAERLQQRGLILEAA